MVLMVSHARCPNRLTWTSLFLRSVEKFIKFMPTLGVRMPALGITDTHLWQAWDALEEVLRKRLAGELAASPYLACSMDDTTAGSQLYTSVVVYYTVGNIPKCALLRLVPIGRGDAASILDATTSALGRCVRRRLCMGSQLGTT